MNNVEGKRKRRVNRKLKIKDVVCSRERNSAVGVCKLHDEKASKLQQYEGEKGERKRKETLCNDGNRERKECMGIHGESSKVE